MQPKLHDRFFIMKLHSVIYNQISAEVYRPMLRYAWQNAGYDIGEPVNNFTGVIDVAFSIAIIECSVMTCDDFAFLHCAFVVVHIALSILLKVLTYINVSALRVASTMTSAVTSRACLHRFEEKLHSPVYSEVHNGPVLKFYTHMFVRTQILPLLERYGTTKLKFCNVYEKHNL